MAIAPVELFERKILLICGKKALPYAYLM